MLHIVQYFVNCQTVGLLTICLLVVPFWAAYEQTSNTLPLFFQVWTIERLKLEVYSLQFEVSVEVQVRFRKSRTGMCMYIMCNLRV